MEYLSLDVGTRHTGVAFADSEVGIALPLDTIHHETDDELIQAVSSLVDERNISTLVLGLPTLLDGTETEQTEYVRSISDQLNNALPTCAIELIDERGTSAVSKELKSEDPHAQAAVALLSVFLDRK